MQQPTSTREAQHKERDGGTTIEGRGGTANRLHRQHNKKQCGTTASNVAIEVIVISVAVHIIIVIIIVVFVIIIVVVAVAVALVVIIIGGVSVLPYAHPQLFKVFKHLIYV